MVTLLDGSTGARRFIGSAGGLDGGDAVVSGAGVAGASRVGVNVGASPGVSALGVSAVAVGEPLSPSSPQPVIIAAIVSAMRNPNHRIVALLRLEKAQKLRGHVLGFAPASVHGLDDPVQDQFAGNRDERTRQRHPPAPTSYGNRDGDASVLLPTVRPGAGSATPSLVQMRAAEVFQAASRNQATNSGSGR